MVVGVIAVLVWGHTRLAATSLGAIVRDHGCARHARQVRHTHHTQRRDGTGWTRGWLVVLREWSERLEQTVRGTLVLVDGHGYSAFARSMAWSTTTDGPLALGLTSKLKISVGTASVAHALGLSTMPLMGHSTAAVPRMAYTCSPEYPNLVR